MPYHQIIRGAVLAGVTAGLVAGCSKPAPKPVDTAAIERDLRAGETQWNADYKAKDVAKITGHYSGDAMLMEPNTAVMSGPAQIQAGISQFVKDPNLDIQFFADRVAVAASGELAYTRGHYRIVTTDPKTSKPQTETGTYVTVYKKQPDGAWKAVEDIATPGAPAAAG